MSELAVECGNLFVRWNGLALLELRPDTSQARDSESNAAILV
jgi:hypothetical protein